MKRDEFNKYLELASSDGTGALLTSNDKHGISEFRARISVLNARIGQELAVMKDKIDMCFLSLMQAEGAKATACIREAEVFINNGNEVSRRELDYLRSSLDNLSNSCASRLNVLLREVV